MENRCPQCGAPMENGHCIYCNYTYHQAAAGTAQQQVPPQGQYSQPNYQQPPNHVYETQQGPAISNKSRAAALILCFIFGLLGIHRFYVGKVGTGILYLITGGIFGIGWIVDLIMIAVGSFKDKYGLQLKRW